MATGLAIPVRAHKGRMMIVDGSRQLDNIILLSASEGDSTNPFENRGITAAVFALPVEASTALVKSQLQRHFARLEARHRARLERIDTKLGGGDGEEFHLEVVYRDLESDTETRGLRRGIRRT